MLDKITANLPPLRATADDVADLRALAASLEAEVRVHYEAFLFDRQRRVDDAMWKPLETDGAIRAFRERASHGHAPLGPQAGLAAAHGSVGRVLIAGVVPGSVDDALFGCCFHDTASLRAREAYQRDPLDESAVLVTVESPTLKDPFRFLGITWHAHSSRLSGHERDYLLLERSHLTTLSTGDHVGVCLRHSVKHRNFPASRDPTTTRVTLSSVTFYRQVDADRIEVFGIELRDEKHHAIDALQRHENVRDLLVSARVCATGFKKKLVWYLEQQTKRYHPAAALPPSDDKTCALCHAATAGMLLNTGGMCILCAKHVCARCSETHEIVLDASDVEIEMEMFAFCAECLSAVRKLPTQRIACEQVVHHREQQQC